MKRIVLALSSEWVQAAIGHPGARAEVRVLCRERVEDGCCTADGWETPIRQLWERHELPRGRVLLVLPGSMSDVRILSLPPMRKRRLQRAVQDELQYSVRQELVSDYILLDQDDSGARRVLACFGKREELRLLADTLKRLGLRLEGVTVPLEPALCLLRTVRKMQDRSCILLCFDGKELQTTLIEKGVCSYTSRTCLRNGPGAEGFSGEVTRKVSGILQFRASQRVAAPLSDVYYAGCSGNDFSDCVSDLRALGLTAGPLPCGGFACFPPEHEISEWAVCAGAMLK